jgi:hypothetical protein
MEIDEELHEDELTMNVLVQPRTTIREGKHPKRPQVTIRSILKS